MLSAPYRLRTPADFRRCIRSGTRAGGRLLVVHLLVPPDVPSDDTAAGLPRVGFVVSRAVGPAVTRNLVKRRLRHLVREHLTELPPAALLVVRAQPAAAAASYDDLGAELASGLRHCLEKVR